MQEGATGYNAPRQAALRAGLPATVPGMTVDQQCGSGLMAIAIAAKQIVADGMAVTIGGGVESISLVQNAHKNTHHAQHPWLAGHGQSSTPPSTSLNATGSTAAPRTRRPHLPAADGSGAADRAVRRRNRAAHRHPARRARRTGSVHPRTRRGQPARHQPRRPRRAQARPRQPQLPDRNRRQRLPALRRRLSRRAHGSQRSQPPRPHFPLIGTSGRLRREALRRRSVRARST